MPSVAETVEWETPQDFFDKLNAEFHFTLDAAASDENAKCERYFTIETDGMNQDWGGATVWLNPPYGPAIPAWMEKAYYESLKGATVVVLVPSRTDTKWWHTYAEKAAERRFVKGRLKFGGCKAAAPFASVVIVFRPPAPQ